MLEAQGLAGAEQRYGAPVELGYELAVTDHDDFFARMTTRRPGEVVMVLRRPEGGYLVHTKAFYPEGVYRLLTGGIHPGEDIIEAVKREVAEETSLEVHIERYLGLLHYYLTTPQGPLGFESFVFLLDEVAGTLASADPDERITDFRQVDLEALADLAGELESLPEDWADWGRFRAIAHRFVVEQLGEMKR